MGMSGMLKSMLVSGWSSIWVGGNGNGPGFLSTSPDLSNRVLRWIYLCVFWIIDVYMLHVCVDVFCTVCFCC